ncbi:proliferating cell nuclear antigen [Athelia psychrophila]|uniref:DNA sliding clamp PCNA n=1 Tax=Athelia psychrophila TaxID=1759441 RepID=A0A166D7F5_9AGAM|nr:proliferating cell nuclear antigen [Fibularhizoctonia sp. CBS 109695]
MLDTKLDQVIMLECLLDVPFVADAKSECTEEGISFQAMGNLLVALVSVKLDVFDEVLKCAKDDDLVTLKAGDDADVLNLAYEAKSKLRPHRRILHEADDIDSDTLSIPDTAYDARVALPAAEFACIMKDLLPLGESIRIEVSQEGKKYARFHDDGEAGMKVEERGGRGDKKKRQKALTKSKPAAQKSKKSSDHSESWVAIEMNQHVKLTFSLKHLDNFAKSSTLCNVVQLMMSNDVPLLCHIRYYLAPKIGGE